MKNLDVRVKRWANYATIIASFTAIITLISGFFLFRQTSKQQAEAASVKMMQDYLQFNFEHKEILERGERGQLDGEYMWYAAHNLLTAETIYNLNRGDKAWEAAVIHIAENNQPYISNPQFPCEEYDKQFIRFLQKHVQNTICPKR